jgi:hypothetical protein
MAPSPPSLLGFGVFCLLLSSGGLIVPAAPTELHDPPAAATNVVPPLSYGVGGDGREQFTRAGINLSYAQLWAGAWLEIDGWNGFDQALNNVTGAGLKPLIQFYYWGDDLTPECFAHGCLGQDRRPKDLAGWDRLAFDLPTHVKNHSDGHVTLVLEPEFNKALRQSEDLDAALATKAQQLKLALPNATIVLGLGNWDPSTWGTFDRAANASDEIGLQILRGPPYDAPDAYAHAGEDLLQGAQAAQRQFHKPILVTDVALSSHDARETAQADGVRSILHEQRLADAGVHALIFRSVYDVPNADSNGHYGPAEQSFGFFWADNKTAKPALAALTAPVEPDPDTLQPAATSAPTNVAPSEPAPVPHTDPLASGLFGLAI